jgi:hypothetical protein
LIGIAPIFAVWPLNSCHAAQRFQQKYAHYALKFVRRAVMNAPNTKWSIVSNALKPAINVLKNAGKWQRNNMEVLPAFLPGGVSNLCHPCMEDRDDHAKYSAAGLLVLTKKGE